jgi:Fic-DOC domain mobile mystery protein B
VVDLFYEPEDATPLAPEERVALLQDWITHRKELNEAEQDNIVHAVAWARRRIRQIETADILTADFVKELHRRMFREVWRWAGMYRSTERNIGAEAIQIPQLVPQFLDNIRYWVANSTHPKDEIAVRLHHGLVQIHPFPNGNGRHTRLIADLLVERMGGIAFTWGGAQLSNQSDLRSRYIKALKLADGHQIEELVAFARS